MNICIIPARGGSKRIPRKNIREFCGQPMIVWSIQAALKAGCFDRIVVSTDDMEIAEVAEQAGADVPFFRSGDLADDYIGTTAVMVHAINLLKQMGDEPTAVCCLYATAPFVRSRDLMTGLKLLAKLPSDRFVFTATRYAFPIQRAIRLDQTGLAQMCHPVYFSQRSQDLEETYHDAGQFYWGRPVAWESVDNLFEGGLPLLLPHWRVQDIDTEADWKRAELMAAAIATVHDDD